MLVYSTVFGRHWAEPATCDAGGNPGSSSEPRNFWASWSELQGAAGITQAKAKVNHLRQRSAPTWRISHQPGILGGCLVSVTSENVRRE